MIVTLRWIYWITAGTVGVIAFFIDAYDWILFPLALALSFHLISNFIFGLAPRRVKEKQRLDDLSEYSQHQDYPIEALVEIFHNEKSKDTLKLLAVLEGTFFSDKSLTAPLSQEKVLAYKIEADLFKKTKLGGEADFVPVATQGSWVDLKISQGGVNVEIQGDRLLNLGRSREVLLTLTTLESKYPDLKTLIYDHIQLAGLTASHFTGVRVRESILLPEESGRVYGTIQKTKTGLVIRGNDVLDDPGSMLLITDSVVNHKEHSAKSLPSPWLNLGLGLLALCVSFFLFLLGPGKGFIGGIPFLGFLQTGELAVTSGTKAFTLKIESDKADSIVFKTKGLKPGENIVLNAQKSPVNIAPDTVVTLSISDESSTDYHKGLMGYPDFKNGHWEFTPGSEATLAKPILDHKGPIYLKNLSGKKIQVRLGSPDNRPELQGWWDFEKDAGKEYDLGTHLIINDRNFDLSQGDFLKLGTEKENFRFFVLGLDQEIRWADKELSWVIDVLPEYLEPREGELWAFNVKAQNLIIKIPDINTPGKVRTAALRDDQALTGWIPVKDEKGQVLRLFEGQIFHVDSRKDTVLYSGPMKNLPQGKWQGNAWKVNLK